MYEASLALLADLPHRMRVPSGNHAVPRATHDAVLMPDRTLKLHRKKGGYVLGVHGGGNDASLALLADPAHHVRVPFGSHTVPRATHDAVLMLDRALKLHRKMDR